MKDAKLLSKIQGCLMGVCIGDALGMPVETMTHEQIMELNDGNGITGFIDPINRKDWTRPLKAGDTTDDWQLTEVVGKSLVNTKLVFDLTDCANEHVRALNESTFGWGGTTQEAIEAIRDGKRKPTDPLPPAAPKRGSGNGVIMKIAPLAISHAIILRNNDRKLWEDCRHLGSLTHQDIDASIAAYAVARMIVDIMLAPVTNLDAGGAFSIVRGRVEDIENRLSIPHRVSERMWKAFDNCRSATFLRQSVGCKFHCLDTVAFTLGTFIRHPCDFRTGVLEAINAGGDTDSNASIVGALIGSNVGLEGIPEEWRNFNPKFKRALELGQQLYDLAP